MHQFCSWYNIAMHAEMKTTIPNFIQKYLTPLAKPKILPLLAIPVAVMAGIVLPGAEADLKNFSGGFGPLDLQFYYTPETAWHFIEKYGPQGRSLYLFLELTAYVAYPIFYTLFFFSLTFWLMKKSKYNLHSWAWAIPFLPILLDFLENTMLVTMLVIYPKQWLLPAFLAGVFTSAKWAVFAALIGFVLYLVFKIKWFKLNYTLLH